MRRLAFALLLASCARDRAPPPAAASLPPLDLPAPIVREQPRIRAGPRLAAAHLGSPFPARSALVLGPETWIATPSGVLRFDAHLGRDPAHAQPTGRVEVADGLPAAGVNALAKGRRGAVRVATDAGLAEVSADGRVRTVGLRGQRVTALSRRLIGTWNGLLDARGRPVAGGAGIPVTALHDCGPRSYVGTHDRGLWILGAAGLRRVSGVPAVRVGGLAGCGPDRRIWAATTSGLYEVAGDRAFAVPAWLRHATTVATNGRTVLFGTFGQGVFELRGRTVRPLASGPRIALLHPTAAGILVGTDDSLAVLRPDGSQSLIALAGPPSGLVTALAAHEGRLCAGSFDQGLACLEQGRWRRLAVPDPRISSLVFDHAGSLWVGTAHGLFTERDQGLAKLQDPRGWLDAHIHFLRRQDDRVWVGAYPGLLAIDPTRDSPDFRYFGARGHDRDAGLSGTTVYGVAFTTATMWVATRSGLGALAPDGARVLTDLGGVLPDDWVNDVRASDQVVYALTLRSGLLSIAPTGTTVLASSLMTSPSGLLLLDGRPLFGTNAAGLALVEQAAEGPRILVFGPAAGLASDTVAALALDGEADCLWVGGSGGIDRIDHASRVFSQPQEGGGS